VQGLVCGGGIYIGCDEGCDGGHAVTVAWANTVVGGGSR